jgi:arylsulfatase A-like enzyme
MPRALGVGVLVGTLWTFVDFFSGFSALRLPISQLIECLAILTYLNTALACALVIVARLPLFARVRDHIGPGWLAVSAFVFVFALAIASRGLGSSVRILVSFSMAAVVAVVGKRLARIPRRISAPSFWVSVDYLGLIACLVVISLRAPLEDHLYAGGVALFVPVVALHLALLATMTRASRRWALLGALPIVAVMAVWFAVPYAHGRRAHSGVNVIVVSIDTLRRDHLGVYGSATKTPRIDALESRGVVFDNALSAIPLTNPSHTTMLTGLYPANHGVTENLPIPIGDGVATLPRILGSRGYKTAGFVSSWTLKKEGSRLNGQFDVYDDNIGTSSSLRNAIAQHAVPRCFVGILRRLGTLRPDWGHRRADRTVAAAQQWLRANADGPFFLFVHLFDPHGPYNPPRPYDTMYDSLYTGSVDGDWSSKSFEERERIIDTPTDLHHLEALYSGEVSYADAQIGKLFDTIDRLGLWDNSIIGLTADHGESLTEHNYYFDHGMTLYDESLRVPLIICFPDSTIHPHRVQQIVELTDLVPTILEFLAIEPPHSDGRSALALARGTAPPPPARVAVSAVFETQMEESRWLLALRSRKYKYIVTSPYWTGYLFNPGITEELYALDVDPGEANNICDSAPDVAERLRSVARSYIDSWHSGAAPEPAKLSDEALKRLRSLGYLQ